MHASSMSNLYLQEVLEHKEDHITPPIDVRITGMGPFKRVVVPPNVYVVHTRQGYEKPLHIGLGISFRYNPYKDAFLVIPSTMQTILINARSICKERQGILVQAYVQWIIDDIETAYRRLDFSNQLDPTATVREQLREQAEATIKDKVSTMSIDEVLSDKRSIMVEMTNRLREVAEGSDSGLGLKIVNVQIKEAVISSARLWEHLQQPFRAEKEQTARLAEIERERVIALQEQQNHTATEKTQISNEQELSLLRAQQEADTFDRGLQEEERREQARLESEQRRLTRELELQQKRAEDELTAEIEEIQRKLRSYKEKKAEISAEIEYLQTRYPLQELSTQQEEGLQFLQAEAEAKRETLRLQQTRALREIENLISQERIQERLIEMLPDLVQNLPTPEHLEQIQISSPEGTHPTLTPLFTILTQLRNILPKG
ncbi:MAG: hypothetical protein H6728_09490 [Myxococcales bacterium]|nr:hypothetical protein [Myxococcales bacterium]